MVTLGNTLGNTRQCNIRYAKSVTDLSFSASVPAVPKTTTVHTSGESVRIKQ